MCAADPTPAELTILRELLDHQPDFVSGNALAATLGVSRVAVWQHMKRLRGQGFVLEAVRRCGYRLARLPSDLNPALVAANLAPRTRVRLVCLDEIDSTNDEAARRLAAGEKAPFAVLARRQTRGRGRLGRSWFSADNGNLYLTLAFRPQLSPDRMQTFTLWMGVNLCELVANFSGATPQLKWPNDLLFNGRKAGGMLTEARIDADRIRDLVFGLGLNVNSPAGGWPPALARTAISLSEVLGSPVDLNRFAAALIGRVLLAYDGFVDGSYERRFAELWHKYDVLRGQSVTLQEGERSHSGKALGIDDDGSLLLRSAAGRTLRFRAGDVTLAPATRGTAR